MSDFSDLLEFEIDLSFLVKLLLQQGLFMFSFVSDSFCLLELAAVFKFFEDETDDFLLSVPWVKLLFVLALDSVFVFFINI